MNTCNGDVCRCEHKVVSINVLIEDNLTVIPKLTYVLIKTNDCE